MSAAQVKAADDRLKTVEEAIKLECLRMATLQDPRDQRPIVERAHDYYRWVVARETPNDK